MKIFVRSVLAAFALMGAMINTVRADSIDIDSETLERVPTATIELVVDFLERFSDSSSRAEEKLDLYTEDVDYFGRNQVSKAEILRDMKRYRRQWPTRDYRISRIEFIYLDPQSDSIYVRYEFEFTVFNPSSAKRVSGRGVCGAVIDDIDGTPKVASIQESIFARKRFREIER